MLLLSAHCHACGSHYVQATSQPRADLLFEKCIYCGSGRVVFHDHDEVADASRAEAA